MSKGVGLTLITVVLIVVGVCFGYLLMRDVVRVGETISVETVRNIRLTGEGATVTGTSSEYFMLRKADTGEVLFAMPPKDGSTEWILEPSDMSEGYWLMGGNPTLTITSDQNLEIALVEQAKFALGFLVFFLLFVIWFMMYVMVFMDD